MSSTGSIENFSAVGASSEQAGQYVFTQTELLRLIDDVKNAAMLDLAEHFRQRPGKAYSTEDLVKFCVRQMVFSQGTTAH